MPASSLVSGGGRYHLIKAGVLQLLVTTFQFHLFEPGEVPQPGIQMPNMSGYDVAIRMRELETERDHCTPILAVTAHSVASLDERSEALAARHFSPGQS